MHKCASAECGVPIFHAICKLTDFSYPMRGKSLSFYRGKIVIIFNYSLISSLNNHSHLFTRGAKTHLCYIVRSFCYISASVTTVKYNVSTTVKKIIGCCFVVYLRVGTVFQTAAYFMFVIPRLRPGLLSLRSVLSSRQTD